MAVPQPTIQRYTADELQPGSPAFREHELIEGADGRIQMHPVPGRQTTWTGASLAPFLDIALGREAPWRWVYFISSSHATKADWCSGWTTVKAAYGITPSGLTVVACLGPDDKDEQLRFDDEIFVLSVGPRGGIEYFVCDAG